MEIIKGKEQDNFTLIVTRTELLEIRDALGMRGLYLEALGRKKVKIARSKDVFDDSGSRETHMDRSRDLYLQIVKEMD
ncbi:MAG: hypothetical protein OIN87_01565 [Candidatus Methanoperedens sp.]|nr:hypothetical protein [Candidatus Methanoperedens sp.]